MMGSVYVSKLFDIEMKLTLETRSAFSWSTPSGLNKNSGEGKIINGGNEENIENVQSEMTLDKTTELLQICEKHKLIIGVLNFSYCASASALNNTKDYALYPSYNLYLVFLFNSWKHENC